MPFPRSVSRSVGVALALSLPCWFTAAVGCSDDGANGGGGGGGGASGSGTGGASGSGTSGSTTAGSAGKGSGGASMGGSASEGGASGSAVASGGAFGGSEGGEGGGGNVEPGEPCTANCPTGRVRRCFDNCPLGPCDEGLMFADERCSTYYPEPVSEETIFCAKEQTATYCLTALDQNIRYYRVSCAAGTPTVTECDSGCAVDTNHAASCND